MLKPRGDRVLVQPDPVVDVTASGLTLVEDWPQETSGRVVALGERVRDLAIDDQVIFPQHVGQELIIGTERLFVMHEKDVLAIVERTT